MTHREKPRMMTVREVARTGLLSENALRSMLKAGKLPAIYIGNRALINYDRLCEELGRLEADLSPGEHTNIYPPSADVGKAARFPQASDRHARTEE